MLPLACTVKICLVPFVAEKRVRVFIHSNACMLVSASGSKQLDIRDSRDRLSSRLKFHTYCKIDEIDACQQFENARRCEKA